MTVRLVTFTAAAVSRSSRLCVNCVAKVNGTLKRTEKNIRIRCCLQGPRPFHDTLRPIASVVWSRVRKRNPARHASRNRRQASAHRLAAGHRQGANGRTNARALTSLPFPPLLHPKKMRGREVSNSSLLSTLGTQIQMPLFFYFFLNVKLFAPPQCRSRVDHPLVRRGREVARRVARMHFNR